MAKRCASSRTRCRRYSASEPAAQADRVGRAGPVHLLELLGQRGQLDLVLEPELAHHPLGHVQLPLAAVDEEQVGPVGEAPGPPALGAARRLLQRGQPPRQHLLHGCVVVVAGHGLDLEAAVVRALGQPVLEHDHGADVVGALQVAHVVALDPQRRLAQRQRALQLGQRLGARVVVRRPAQPVPGQVLAGRAGHRLLQRALRPALRARRCRPVPRARCAASSRAGRGPPAPRAPARGAAPRRPSAP